MGGEAETGCYDCGLPYSDPGFQDLIVPLDIWRRISPTGDEGGLLCACCICRRLLKEHIRGVPGAFMSGPIRTVDRTTMNNLRRVENLELQVARMQKGGDHGE